MIWFSRSPSSAAWAPTDFGEARHARRVETDDHRVQAGGDGAEDRLVGGDREAQRVLPHQVSLEDEHEQRLGVVELDEVEVLDADTQRTRGGDQADRVRRLGQRRRRQLEDVLDAARHNGEVRVDLAAHRGRDVLLVHEEVDVVPVPEIGGHATRRGVRLDQVADLAERRQLVADRRGRPRGEMHGEGRRPHGDARAGVVGDHSLEDLLLALIERDLLHVQIRGDGVRGDRPRAPLALVMVEC